jgi:hypothetical protein
MRPVLVVGFLASGRRRRGLGRPRLRRRVRPAAIGGLPDDFVACWTVDPSLAVDPRGPGSDCHTLDAHACAVRDDCVTDLAVTAGGGELGNCRAKANGATVAGACTEAACGAVTCTASCYPCVDGTFGGVDACAGFDCGTGHTCVLRGNGDGVECTPECITGSGP